MNSDAIATLYDDIIGNIALACVANALDWFTWQKASMPDAVACMMQREDATPTMRFQPIGSGRLHGRPV
jgi:hypothetical protein